MKVSSSVKIAAIFFVAVLAYFAIRGAFRAAPAEEAAVEEARFTVVTQSFSPQNWQSELLVRGRTAAKRKVVVRAETSGVIASTPATEGTLVREGEILCQLDVDARKPRSQRLMPHCKKRGSIIMPL